MGRRERRNSSCQPHHRFGFSAVGMHRKQKEAKREQKSRYSEERKKHEEGLKTRLSFYYSFWEKRTRSSIYSSIYFPRDLCHSTSTSAFNTALPSHPPTVAFLSFSLCPEQKTTRERAGEKRRPWPRNSSEEVSLDNTKGDTRKKYAIHNELSRRASHRSAVPLRWGKVECWLSIETPEAHASS